MDISSIISNIDTSDLNEETASLIAEAFQTAVEEKVTANLELQVEKALSRQDEEHAAKLEKLLEAIDADHSDKLQKVVGAINTNHAVKLDKLVSFYRKALNERAEKFGNKVVNELSTFIDKYIQSTLPYTELKEAVSNTYAKSQLDKIKGIISIDPEAINESVKGVITQGKKKIDNLEERLNESYKDNLILQEELENAKSSLLLEQKTRGMSSSKKGYVLNLLSDKSRSYIEENFNYVIEMFEKDETKTTNKLVEEAKKTSISKDVRVPTKVFTESVNTENTSEVTPVNSYLSALKEIR